MGRRSRSLFDRQGMVVFVTTTVMNFHRIFGLGEAYYLILLESLKYVRREHDVSLLAYVFMPSHLHFVGQFPEGESLSEFMRDFKKFTSTKIRKQLERDGHDDWVEQLRYNAKRNRRQVFKLWKDRFDDVVIESEEVLATKIEYIHNNPVKAGLVRQAEEWKYSSARNYFLNDHSLIEVVTDW